MVDLLDVIPTPCSVTRHVSRLRWEVCGGPYQGQRVRRERHSDLVYVSGSPPTPRRGRVVPDENSDIKDQDTENPHRGRRP